MGPTAIMALMTHKISHFGPEYAVLLTLLSGVIILACGLLQLGFLIDFISLPVIVGFTSSAAVTIASGQASSQSSFVLHTTWSELAVVLGGQKGQHVKCL